jgi:SAM-dependent methyltransferase
VTSSLHTTFSGSIPEYYDRCLGPAWFGPFGRELAALLPPDPGGDVLEIACGTGLVTRELRERLAPSRRLVASDLNKPMLDYARSKLGEFAAVACALGFMFMPDKPKAFSQARRVLKRGGTLILSVWDRAEENDAARIYAETIEALFPGDQEMRFRLPWSMHDQVALRKLLGDARFEVARMEKKRLSVGDVDARTIATGQVRGTPRGLLLERKGVSMDEAIERVASAIAKYLASPGARLHGQAILVEARAA